MDKSTEYDISHDEAIQRAKGRMEEIPTKDNWWVNAFDPSYQRWYANREETIAEIENGGSTLSTSSCDMIDILQLAEEREWVLEHAAGGVMIVRPGE
jgi:hypothetical protein